MALTSPHLASSSLPSSLSFSLFHLADSSFHPILQKVFSISYSIRVLSYLNTQPVAVLLLILLRFPRSYPHIFHLFSLLPQHIPSTTHQHAITHALPVLSPRSSSSSSSIPLSLSLSSISRELFLFSSSSLISAQSDIARAQINLTFFWHFQFADSPNHSHSTGGTIFQKAF
ncbi:hypothetical protein GQ42DRAFT_59152 [Ramicandelaber brevisporus]|nr:hypothetical protein GQ42DRAFT_59152 [Ramicandelaber brevisporus]